MGDEERQVLQAVADALEGNMTIALCRVEQVRDRGLRLVRTCARIARWTWNLLEISDAEWEEAMAIAGEDLGSYYLLLEFQALRAFKLKYWSFARSKFLYILTLLPPTELLRVLMVKIVVLKCCFELQDSDGAGAAARDVMSLMSEAGPVPAHMEKLCDVLLKLISCSCICIVACSYR